MNYNQFFPHMKNTEILIIFSIFFITLHVGEIMEETLFQDQVTSWFNVG